MVRRATLAQTFFVAGLSVALVVAASFAFFLRDSRARILDFSERLRLAAAQRVEQSVAHALGTAEGTLNDVASDIRAGAVDPDDAHALEVELFTKLSSSPHLAEITFTRARVTG